MIPVLLQAAGFLSAFAAGVAVALKVSGRRLGPGAASLPPGEAEAAADASAFPVAKAGSLSLEADARAKHLVFNHELKNYLCAIRGNSFLLRQGTSGAAQSAIIDRIDQVLAKIENFACKAPVAPDVITPRSLERIDLAQLARNCSQVQFAQSGMEFPCFAFGDRFFAQGDPHRLEQVFQNLYANAREAGASRVSTRFRIVDDQLGVAIEDNGQGCSAETARRIFEPFFSTKTGKRNKGLGMFIVRSIVESHGGRIWAQAKNKPDGSSRETGLIVYLSFPLSVINPSYPSKAPCESSRIRQTALTSRA